MEPSLSNIKGHQVSEIRFSNNVELVFRGDYDALSAMIIEGTIVMRRGTEERLLDAWQGGQWKPSVFSPMLELLGSTVTEVFVVGALLTFSNAWQLSVVSDDDWEPRWSFRSGKNASKHIARNVTQ